MSTTTIQPHNDHLKHLPISPDALEALPFPTSIYTCDGLLVGANSLVQQLFQVPNTAVVGTFNILTDPRPQYEISKAIFQEAAAGRRTQSPPYYDAFSFPDPDHPRQPGAWIAITAFPFPAPDGQITHVGLIFQDVTAQAEDERQMAQFKTLINNAGDGIGVTDLEGRLIFANPAFHALTGYGQELIGTPLVTIHPEQDVLSAAGAEVLARGTWVGQIQTRRSDGSVFQTGVSAFLVHDHQGQPSGMAAIMRDLTEERARERELRLMQISLDQSTDSILWIDPKGQIIFANQGAGRMLGYTRDELERLSITDIEPAFPFENWDAIWGRLVREGRQSFESIHRRKDGAEVPVDVVSNFLHFEGYEFCCSFARDISERKRTEGEQLILQEQIIAAQQMALRELSTPLIPIADGVVVMPLIGSIDSSRAQLVIETLLSGVAELRASTTIIDITGVPVVDTQVANALLRAAQAVKLLGAQVILTGIRPEVAQTLVGLGVDLGGIVTRGTLQSGIAEALGRRRITP